LSNPAIILDYAAVRGFNYQPSYGSSGFELWRRFDAGVIRRELELGKRYFPAMNAIRLWLTHDAWVRDHARFEADFDTALAIASDLGLLVMPVLFNRWHDAALDYGGIYLDHFLPGSSWVQGVDQLSAFTEAIVGAHARDPRIFSWDLCNEPFAYGCDPDTIPNITSAEQSWLERMAGICRAAGATAPITVGVHQGGDCLRRVEPISDLLSIHPYATNLEDVAGYEAALDGFVEFAASVGKPILATETIWGSTDDARRVQTIHYTLGQLKSRKIGWLAYLLHHSLIADAHREEFGPMGGPGNLSFIEADDTLRPGHDAFNEY